MASPLVLAIALLGCAGVSSPRNYDVIYRATGPADESVGFHKTAESSYRAEVTTEDRRKEISATKVYIDTVPPELTLKDNVVSIAEGVAATLVGTVELHAVFQAPQNDADLIPSLQKATESARSDIAFCPRDQQLARMAQFRCYLVKRGKAPASAVNPTP
jgi:hypothetical protein